MIMALKYQGMGVIKTNLISIQYIDHYGDMVYKNWKTGETAVVNFLPRSWFYIYY